MKKYTKRLLAFLLATVMVLTGLPMSAQEVKAADPTDFSVKFSSLDLTNTEGPVTSSDNKYTYYYLMKDAVGENWKLNSTSNLADGDIETTAERTSKTPTATYSVSNGKFQYIQTTANNTTHKFGFTAPAAGAYNLTVNVGMVGNGGLTDVWVNDTYLGRIDQCTTTNLDDILTVLGVTLKEGEYANEVKFTTYTNTGGNKKAYFRLTSLNFTVPTEEVPLATAVMDATTDIATLKVGDTATITTTFSTSNGSFFVADKAGYTYAYEYTTPDVVSVENNTVTALAGGNTTVTVKALNPDGSVAATDSIDFKVVAPTVINFLKFDKETLDNGYICAGTVGTGWSVSADNDDCILNPTSEENATSKKRVTMAMNSAKTKYTDMRFNDEGSKINFDITLDAGIYDVSTAFTPVGKAGYVHVYFDGEYIGTVNCNSQDLTDTNNLLQSITVAESGTHKLGLVTDYAHNDTGDNPVRFNSVTFSPVEVAGSVVGDSLVAIIHDATLELADEDPDTDETYTLGNRDYTGVAFSASTTNGGYYFMQEAGWTVEYVTNNPEVSEVKAYADWAKLTGTAPGTTTVTATATSADGATVYTGTSAEISITYPVTNTYTITWLNEDGSEIEVDTPVAYGTTATCDTEVAKAETETSVFKLAGWTADGETLVEDFTVKKSATYTAVFTEEYKITWDINGEKSVETYAAGETPVAPEVGDIEIEGVAYIFKGWDKEIAPVTGATTYTAVFGEETQSYTITFVDEDGTTLYETTVAAGELPIYKGDEPTKAATAQYTYKFAGWSPDVVEATVGATYTATYEATVNTYTVTWVVDGNEIPETYEYGVTPEFKGVTEKAKDAQYTYTFSGWDVEPVAVTGNVTYTAQFDKTVNKYLVTFKDADGSTIKSEEVAYGEVPACEDPVKAEDVYATYTFAGWTPDVVAVEREAVYQATYEATPKTYTVTWVVDGVTTEETYEAGQIPAFKGSTYKAADAEYKYTFTGWDADLMEVTADVTYTAQYLKTLVTYTITWLNHDGSLIASDELVLGETPEAPTASYKEYTFTGWDAEIVPVEGDATYTAIYDIDGIDEGYYYVDGKVKGNAGVIQIGEDLYFVCYSGKIAAGQNMTVPANKTNGLVEAGTYYFFDNGTMENPADDLKGTIGEDGYYYVKGEVRKNVGLVKIGDVYYYVHYSGKVVKGANQTVPATKLNNYEVEAGTYYFYANGVMATAAVKASGEVKADGYYYVYDELTKNVGLVQLANGDFIYVHYSGKVVQNGYQTVTTAKANGHTEFVGVRKFVDGVMIQ